MNFRYLPSVDVNAWAFLLGSDYIREHLIGCVFTSPLQAKPFIARREAGRPLGKICALYGSKKSIDLRKGKRQFTAQLLGLPFYTTKDAALRFLAGLGDGFVFQILKI